MVLGYLNQWKQEVFKLRKRSNHRAKNFFKTWLRWLQKLWRSFLKLLRILFIGEQDHPRQSQRSHREQKLNDQSSLSNEPPILNSRPTAFLLGLEDIDNLEFLTTKELIEQIEWNSESQEILPVKEEDLTLLEDLLVNFPES